MTASQEHDGLGIMTLALGKRQSFDADAEDNANDLGSFFFSSAPLGFTRQTSKSRTGIS
jgi:hypothetical protein